MTNMILKKDISAAEQIAIMANDARYDVADSSDCLDMDIVLGIKSKAAPPKVPKVFLSNDCVFNCAYCGCRVSTDGRRYCNSPRELAKLAVSEAAAKRQGIFITSAIHKNADYTQELILETLKVIRNEFSYTGYVHAKVMPGADPLLIERAGQYADRLSVNIEVARSEGYSMVAKQKNKQNILTPMKHISDLITAAKSEKSHRASKFATSQSTQLMAGSTGEDDRTILTLSQALYKKFNLKRVYYTAFQYREPAIGYQLEPVSTPRWRMHRLYQADRLMELYGFKPDEITPESEANLEPDIDPKAAWSLRNAHLFPIEVNTADYEELIRIPGIGTVYAKRILEARRYCRITFDILKGIGIPLVKSAHFITCGGKHTGISGSDTSKLRKLLASGTTYEPVRAEQLSFLQTEL